MPTNKKVRKERTATPKVKRPKKKGTAFELKCCRLLQKWWGKNFKRVPLSGGWDKSIVTGDIFPITEDGKVDTTFPFSVECKNQQGWNFNQVMNGDGKFFNWWEQCLNDCSISNKRPMLLFTQNGWPIYIAVDTRVLIVASLPYISRTDPTLQILRWDDFCQVVMMEHIGLAIPIKPPDTSSHLEAWPSDLAPIKLP